MNMNTARKPAGIKYRLIKERIPQGTDSVHYIVPIQVNGRATQEIPVSELEANPAKYASMFPQYFERVKPATGAGSSVTIRSLNKDYKIENGKVVKKTTRRTVADIAPQTAASEPKTKTATTTVVTTQTSIPDTDLSAGSDAGGKKARK